jgi:hypothetical protein
MNPINLEGPMLQDMLKDKMTSMKSASAEDLLAALGLERRRSVFEILGTHAAILMTGLILGAGIALLLAPKSGRALRQEIKTKASDLADRIGEKAGEATSEIRSVLSPAEDGKPKTQQGKREDAHQRT